MKCPTCGKKMPAKHGLAAYNRGCRCSVCRKARQESNLKYRLKKAKKKK